MNDIQNLVFDRAQKEFDSFIKNLESLTGKEVVQYCYEKVIKEDFLLLLEPDRDNWFNIEFLADIEYPLEFLYHEWLGEDSSWLSLLEDTIYNSSMNV